MKTNSVIFLLLIILISPNFSFSQKYFVPGIVITNSGDTIHGLINDREWNNNPTEVQFKKSKNDHVMLYSPITAKSFEIYNGDRYISFSDSVEFSSLRTAYLSEIKTPERIMVTTFIRAIILGKVSLFYLKDRNDREHFLILKDSGSIKELYYKRYQYRTNPDNPESVSAEIAIYKSQLVQLLSDCDTLSNTLTNRSLNYTVKDLSAVIKDYNDCSGQKGYYEEPKEKWHLNVTVEAGSNISKLLIKGNLAVVNELESGYKLGYILGVGVDAIFPRNHGHWSFSNQVMLKNFETTFNIEAARFTINYNLVYLKLASTVRYHFLNSEVRPFFEVGIANSYAAQDIHRENSDPYLLFNSFRRYEQGIVIGLGIPYKSLEFHPMLELSNGMSDLTEFQTTFTSWYFELGYKF